MTQEDVTLIRNYLASAESVCHFDTEQCKSSRDALHRTAGDMENGRVSFHTSFEHVQYAKFFVSALKCSYDGKRNGAKCPSRLFVAQACLKDVVDF